MENWKENTIEHLCKRIQSGGTPKSDMAEYYGGEIPFVTIEDITASDRYLTKTKKSITEEGVRNSAAWVVPVDSIMYSIYATLGVPLINKIKVATNQAILNLIVNSHKIDREYLYYYLLSLKSQIYQFSTQTTQSNLNAAIVKSFKVRYPENITEQTRIAQILSKADEAISQTEALIAKYQRIKTGLIQDLLTRGIDENGNIRSKATHEFVVKNGMEVPVEWEVDNLEKYCNKIGDGVHSSVTFSVGESVPFLFVSCIKEGEILWKNTTQISEIEYERIGIKVNKNDDVVLYSVVGSYGNAVKVSGATKLAFQRHIAYMIPQKGILNANFLEVLLNSQYGKKQADFFAIGNAQKTITLGALKNYTIILPPIEEQENVLQAIQKQEKIIKDCQNHLTKLQSLKKGLMQDLLSGKVRVNN
jgi:type I restriction enzyme, S subunit